MVSSIGLTTQTTITQQLHTHCMYVVECSLTDVTDKMKENKIIKISLD